MRPHLAHRELGTYDEPPGQASTLAGPVQRGEPGPEEPCGAQETGSPVPPLAGGAWPLGGLVSSSGWTARARGRRPGLEHGGAAVVGGAAAAAPPGLRDGVAEPVRGAAGSGGPWRGRADGPLWKEGQGLARRRRGPAAGPVTRASTPRPLEGRLRPRGALFPGHGR